MPDRHGACVEVPSGVLAAVDEAVRRAPSILNTQPWRLRHLPDGLAVSEDLGRALPVIDPLGRDRLISCGAAIFNARVALQAAGYRIACQLLPDPEEPALVGLVRAVAHDAPSDGVVCLSRMVPNRRTHRRLYRSHAIAEQDLLDLEAAVRCEGAKLMVAGPGTRQALARLLHHAVGTQLHDSALRGEVEDWVRRKAGPWVDGVPVEALGDAPFPVDSLLHSHHRGAGRLADLEAELSRSTVLVVSTSADDRQDWLAAGMALERLLLVATAKGLVVTFLHQALQDSSVRGEVAGVLGGARHPQVMLRIGRPLQEAPGTPRRSVQDLLRSRPAFPAAASV